MLTILLLAAIATESTGPESSASPSEIVSGIASSRSTVLVSGVVFLVAMIPGLAFVVGVASLALRSGARVLSAVASASGLLAIALLTVYAAGFAALAASIDEISDHRDLVYVVFRMISATDDGAGVFIAIFVGSTAVVLVRIGACPAWLAILGFVAAAVRAVGAFDITTLGALPFVPFMVGGTILCLLWLAITSTLLVRTPRAAPLPGPALRRPRESGAVAAAALDVAAPPFPGR